MFKLIVLSAFLAVAAAKPGLLGAPLVGAPFAYAPGPVAYSAPLAYSAPIVKAAVPVATSYANTYKVSVKSPLVAAYAAPAYHAPIVATPAFHSPIVAAPAYHAPLAYSSPFAPTYLH